VVTLPSVKAHGEVVSSTVIRREVTEGDVTQAGRLLGRPFVLTGEIVGGTGTGANSRSRRLICAPNRSFCPQQAYTSLEPA